MSFSHGRSSAPLLAMPENQSPSSPPHKRRRLLSAVRGTMTQYSDILSAFGATPSPTSLTKLRREASHPTWEQTPSALEPDAVSNPTSKQTTPNSESSVDPLTVDSPAQPDTLPDTSCDSDDSDMIIVKHKSSEPKRRLENISHPKVEIVVQKPLKVVANQAHPVSSRRSSRIRASDSAKTPLKPQRKIAAISNARRRESLRILTSDTMETAAPRRKFAPDTARNRVRQDILENTKPKRDAFILEHKDYFLPVLPENNYVNKLIKAEADDGFTQMTVPYEALQDQPKHVKAVMKPYQLEGLSFLIHMYRNGMSGILGDEMGLGKTLQTLSLFQFLAENEPTIGEHRPHLVICPLSVLSSWINESRKWVPNLRVIRFHGVKNERNAFKAEMLQKTATASKNAQKGGTIDVVVTTYETFVAEQAWLKRAFPWRYCVLDEGHKIKNEKSEISHALQSIKAEFRLLLTGTPLQNNLHEMWALLHWLFPQTFRLETSDMFKRAFDLTKGQVSTSFMDDARRLLELVMLRRMKSSPGVNLGLPPKTEILLYVPLSPLQRFWYTRLITKADNAMFNELFMDTKTKALQSLNEDAQEDKKLSVLEQAVVAADSFNATDSTSDAWAETKQIMEAAIANEKQVDKTTGDWRKLMNLIMQLRKVCSHPYLLKHAAPEPYYITDHIIKASGKFIVLEKLIQELVLKQRKKILIFSGFTKTLDLCEDLLALKGGNDNDATFKYLRLDGSTGRARRNLGIRLFNQPGSEFQVMLISTRAGGLGINLATASDVIFLDEDWNPQITLQAEARAHRIGQINPVTIYKICSQGTVEEQMMGRIRKKLYLSAKITESMQNIHSADYAGESKKRKRGANESEDNAPHLNASQLKSLLRKGASTLVQPAVDIDAMLNWDFETMIDNCKDKADDPHMVGSNDQGVAEQDEQEWLNSMEKVETALFEGRQHHKELMKQESQRTDLIRADRRIDKNTTVMVDGFAISKESMNCGDWEAVPTMAGKDPRLAEPVREKKAAIVSQEQCQVCWDGGEIYCCSGCPRSYHYDCLEKRGKVKANSKMNFFCPQHECYDCEKSTGDAGGLLFRCRWCAHGYCEECMDWDKTNLIGESLPELLMLGFGEIQQAWYIECQSCVEFWESDASAKRKVDIERKRRDGDYDQFLAAVKAEQEADMHGNNMVIPGLKTDSQDFAYTPATISEVATPVNDLVQSESKSWFSMFGGK